jgi:hypothetical protein
MKLGNIGLLSHRPPFLFFIGGMITSLTLFAATVDHYLLNSNINIYKS